MLLEHNHCLVQVASQIAPPADPAKYNPSAIGLKTPPEGPLYIAGMLEDLERRFHELIAMRDPDILRIVLATVAAIRLPGAPVWLFVVGPPSSAKSILVNLARKVPSGHSMSTLRRTLSGHPGRADGLRATSVCGYRTPLTRSLRHASIREPHQLTLR